MPNSYPEYLRSGKVRDLYTYENELWIIATDRISAYDIILKNPIPNKGILLTMISQFWFAKLSHICPHHLISCDLPEHLRDSHTTWKGRLMRCKKTTVIPLECIVRGYLAGSAWQEYQMHGTVGGFPLPKGMRRSQALPVPLFTPAKKNEEGHDENLTEHEARSLVGNSLYEKLRATSLALYNAAAAYLAPRFLILADTKFEFGLINDQIIWIDEALTPDSSRYWDQEKYSPGEEPNSYDKQYVRDYLRSLDQKLENDSIELPDFIINQTRERYEMAYKRILTP